MELVFVCYARQDEEFTSALAGKLKERGVPVWLDLWDIEPGADWDQSIDTALHKCSHFLIVLSSSSVTSREVRGELHTALNENKAIMPILYQQCNIPRQLQLIQYIDCTSKSPEQTAHRILEHLAVNEGNAKGHSLSNSEQKIISHISSTQMFPGLRAARFEQNDLLALGNAMTSEEPEPNTDAPILAMNPEENSGISAGYTYLGQFIDHDLTFSEDSRIGRHGFGGDLGGTAAFDLSCIYGKGPAKEPYLYSSNGLRMALGGQLTGAPSDPNARQVPRTNAESGEPARALIADPRNDENLIISQLHAAMLRFHNRVADVLRTDSLEEIQQVVRFHYQWVVLYDFLPTIIGVETL